MKQPDPATTAVGELGLELEASRFAPLITTVQQELVDSGITLKPRFYLSTEYGCVTASTTIGLLWTDGFLRWQRLAKRRGLRTRPPRLILTTLRHEVGHAFCYGHKLYDEPEFRRLFELSGQFFETYPDVWKPTEADRDRLRRGEVILLYATRHADEDFAICFQTWLETAVRKAPPWQRRYKHSPRIYEKIEYVESAVQRHGLLPVAYDEDPLDEPVDEVRQSVEQWMDAVLVGTNYNLLPDSPVGSHASADERAMRGKRA